MNTLQCILKHVALGRLLVLCLLLAPPAACTTASDEASGEPVSRTTQRGPVEFTVTIDSEQLEVGRPMTVELTATAHPDATIATPLVDVDENGLLGGFHVLDSTQRPDYPGVDGQRVWSQTLTVDTFTPGTLELPAFTISFEDRRGEIIVDGQLMFEASRSPSPPPSVSIERRRPPGHPRACGRADQRLDPLVERRIGPRADRHRPAARRWNRLRTTPQNRTVPGWPGDNWTNWPRACSSSTPTRFPFRLSDILRHYIEGRFGMRAAKKTTRSSSRT